MSRIDLSRVKSRLETFKNGGKTEKKPNPNAKYFWRPTGEHVVRLVPYINQPDWPFIELKFYYGLNGKNYLAPECVGKPDPIKEYVDNLKATYDKVNFVKACVIEATTRTYSPLIVRGEEEKGVRFWGYGVTVYNDILGLINDVDWGDITDPKTGRDITVTFRSKEELKAQYPKTSIKPKPDKKPALSDEFKHLLDEQRDILTLWPVPTEEEILDGMETYIEKKLEEHAERIAKAVEKAKAEAAAKAAENDSPDLPDVESPSAEQAQGNEADAENEFDAFFANANQAEAEASTE